MTISISSRLPELASKLFTDIGAHKNIAFSIVATVTGIAVLIFAKLAIHWTQPRWGESRREQLGRWARCIPYVERKYNQILAKETESSLRQIRENWAPFGEPILKVPEQPWTQRALIDLIDFYADHTLKGLEHHQFSGAIYPCTLLPKTSEASSSSPFLVNNYDIDQEDPDDLIQSALKLQRVFAYAFTRTHLWNPLHNDEFPAGSFITYQVVRMVADLYGGAPDEVQGLVTGGGTISIMTALRCYRNWGISERGHRPGEGIILAGKSVHAAVMKAADAYLLNVVFIDTDDRGQIDIRHLSKLARTYGKQVIAIIGSAPSYPTGVIDEIPEMARIAHQLGCGMHVDCCLGGFIVNELDFINNRFLQIEGVTSLSADTHKNGLAPKGSSVLVTKKLGSNNLIKHSIYTVPDWRGGLYGTPSDEGSQSSVHAVNAMIALLGTGRVGYRTNAQKIYNAAKEIESGIRELPALEMIASPMVNVVAFKAKDSWLPIPGSSYALAKKVKEHGVVLSTLSNNQLHFCITPRFFHDRECVRNFLKALAQSIRDIEERFRYGEEIEGGQAGAYGSLKAAINPTLKNSPGIKWVENFLLGPTGAKDAIRYHFLAQL